MKNRILRFRFEPNLGPRELQLPVGSEVLSAAWYNGAPALWVLSPDLPQGEHAKLEVRRFLLATIGQSFDDDLFRFLGVAHAQSHEIAVFEIKEIVDRIRGIADRAEKRLGTVEDAHGLTLVGLLGRIEEVAERVEALETPEGESLVDIASRIEALSRETTTSLERLTDDLENARRELRSRVDTLEERGGYR